MFSRLSREQLAEVMRFTRSRVFKAAQVVFAQGDRHRGVFLIRSGIVRTFYTAPDGRELTLAYWRRGNLVGTPEVLGEGAHQWSGVTAAETRVLELRVGDLRRLVEEIPALAIGVIEALEFKGKCFSAIVQMLGTMSVSQRVSSLLAMLMPTHGMKGGGGVVLKEPFTHHAIAQMAGASRQSITIELNRLQERGLVRLGRRSLTILQPELLGGGAI